MVVRLAVLAVIGRQPGRKKRPLPKSSQIAETGFMVRTWKSFREWIDFHQAKAGVVGMAEKQVVIRKDGQEVERVESLNGYSIAEGYDVQAYVDGTVISADVKEGGLLQALGGEISGTRIFQGGLFEVQTGTVDDTLVLSGGRLVAQGTVTDTSVIGGTASIRKGGQAQGCLSPARESLKSWKASAAVAL